MKDQFGRLAYYNKWANGRIYAAAGALTTKIISPTDVRSSNRCMGHSTISWLSTSYGSVASRGTFTPSLPWMSILHDNFNDLHAARIALDDHIIDVVNGMDEASINGVLHWITTEGQPYTSTLDRALTQIFNHQTHHRGQVHTLLSQLTGDAPPIDFFLCMNDDFHEKGQA